MSWPRGGLHAAGQRELRGAGSDRLVASCHPERSEGSVWVGGTKQMPAAVYRPSTPIPRYARNDILIIETSLEAPQQFRISRIVAKSQRHRCANTVAKIWCASIQCTIQPLKCLVSITHVRIS